MRFARNAAALTPKKTCERSCVWYATLLISFWCFDCSLGKKKLMHRQTVLQMDGEMMKTIKFERMKIFQSCCDGSNVGAGELCRRGGVV